MLELGSAEVRAFWQATDPELAVLLDRVGRTEDWTLDADPGIAQRLSELADQLSVPGNPIKLAKASRSTLAFFFAYIRTDKAFLLIRWLDEHHDQLGSRLVEHILAPAGQSVMAEVVDPLLADVMVKRLRVMQNTPYFTRLLAPAALDSIQAAIERFHTEVVNHET
jgi:hypothetical protein